MFGAPEEPEIQVGWEGCREQMCLWSVGTNAIAGIQVQTTADKTVHIYGVPSVWWA